MEGKKFTAKIQNKVIRLLAGAASRDHASPLYAQLYILSLGKLVLLVLASFMHKYHLKKLPKMFDNIFTLVSSIYSRSTRTVVLKLVGSIEPNRCHASIHRTLNYNQERIQKILEGDAVLN